MRVKAEVKMSRYCNLTEIRDVSFILCCVDLNLEGYLSQGVYSGARCDILRRAVAYRLWTCSNGWN